MRELIGTEEVWELTGDSDTPTAKTTCLRIARKEDGRVYVLDYHSLDFDLDDLEAPAPIPSEHLATPWQCNYLQVSQPLPTDAYVKVLSPITYRFDCPKAISEELRHEIEAYTLLSSQPHSNICPFYGCVREDQYATGIVLKRMSRPLESWGHPESSPTRLSILRGIKRGIDHMHSLGLVHNDLNPNNVMLDGMSRPVIVDFGASRREGTPKDVHAGTPGWFRQSDRSLRENDYFALGLIAKWLDGWEHNPTAVYKEQYHSCWTDQYLQPKMLAVSSSSHLFSQMLSRMLELGGHATVLRHNFDSDGLTVSVKDAHQVRMLFGKTLDENTFRHAWDMAGQGLRCGDVDIVLFPISPSHDLPEQIRRLKTLVRTIPRDLRRPFKQPCIALFLVDAVWRKRWVFDLERAIRQLFVDAWPYNARASSDDAQLHGILAVSEAKSAFGNFVLLWSADSSQVSDLRLRYWQRAKSAGGWFSRTEYAVRVEQLFEVLSEPPQFRQNEESELASRLSSINISSIFWMLAVYFGFTLYLLHRFAP